MNDYQNLDLVDVGAVVVRPVLISKIVADVAKNGDSYLRFEFMDGDAVREAKMFSASIDMMASKGIDVGSIVDAKILIDNFGGSKNFKFKEIDLNHDPSLSKADFVRYPPEDIDKMFREIRLLVLKSSEGYMVCNGGWNYAPLSDLVLSILSDYMSDYKTSSAAESMHHNHIGGLIYHSYMMAKTADAICDVYDYLDRELLVCGAVLHDIGKLRAYATSEFGAANRTVDCILEEHLFIGAEMIGRYGEKKYNGRCCNPEKVRLLKHMILSHHGKLEWGAPVLPATPEAFVLSFIDDMDAKLFMFVEAYKNMAPGEKTDKSVRGLDRRVYKPDYFTDRQYGEWG